MFDSTNPNTDGFQRFDVPILLPVVAETAEDAKAVAEGLLARAQYAGSVIYTRNLGRAVEGGSVGDPVPAPVAETPAEAASEAPSEPVEASA